MVVVSGCYCGLLLLVVVGRRCWLLVVVGCYCCWLLLVVLVGFGWLLFVLFVAVLVVVVGRSCC